VLAPTLKFYASRQEEEISRLRNLPSLLRRHGMLGNHCSCRLGCHARSYLPMPHLLNLSLSSFHWTIYLEDGARGGLHCLGSTPLFDRLPLVGTEKGLSFVS